MKPISSKCSVVAAAIILLLSISISQHEANAFAPTTRTINDSHHTTIVKGRENTVLFTVATTAKSSNASKKSSVNEKKQSSPSTKQGSKKNKKNQILVKNVPKRNNKRKGKKNTSKSKSFKPLKDLQLGSKVSGTVVDVCDFGAFINIGYATRGSRAGTALLHISQIQDEKIEKIHDVIKVGDTIEGARVTSIDLKKCEVGLSLRNQRQKRRDFSQLKIGDQLDGKVDKVVPYGVFVDVGTTVNPLLHISRITGGAIENVRHHLNEGDTVSVHVIDIDVKKKTVAVSMLDKKADQYLDRRMSQRLKRYYGTARTVKGAKKTGDEDGVSSSSDLDYFDQAIRELEEALREKED